MTYLDELAEKIRAQVSEEMVPEGSEQLFRVYAVLLRAKGASITESDVHDAWSAWMIERDPEHASVRPYEQLDSATQAEDRPFLQAILTVDRKLRQVNARNQ